MSEETAPLQPVSFRREREHAPRLSKPYTPGSINPRHWPEADKEFLRQNYGRMGGVWCSQQLGRKERSVYYMAHALGLKGPKEPAARRPRIVGAERDALDERIRERWPELEGRGAVQALADELGVARPLLSKRVVALGLTMPHRKELDWTQAEEELLRRAPLHDPDKAARIFREHGFTRSPTAIMIKCKRLGLSRRYRGTFSAPGAAALLGMDNRTLTNWIEKGWIKAVKRETRRLPQQGGDPWSIERTELRRVVIEMLERIDFRKVDKFALVDLLVTTQPPPEALAARPAPIVVVRKRCSPWNCQRCRKLKRKAA